VILAVSQSTADDALRFAKVDPRRVQVVPEGVDAAYAPTPGAAERVRQRWGIEPGYLLFVGALDARKDPSALLEAWAAARLDRTGLELVIAGDPGPQAPPNMPGAQMVGRITGPELADLYTAAGCFVFPSRYEGFGLPCLEAMACGCPVAAYRNSSMLEVVNGAGQLVDDGDAQALGHAAESMAADQERWRRAGLERAKSFSWRKAAEQTIKAYEKAALAE
jgi:glycosyltransferase involved in cell wall biosynthesis